MTDDVKALVERVSRLLPVVVNNTPDYAELSFGDAHPTQAMTMAPDDWLALNELIPALTAQADEITRLRAALKPFADCCEYISDDEDNDEWAKFRLIIKNYRDARAALKAAQEVKA